MSVDKFLENIGINIRRIRDKQQLSAEEFGKNIGVTRQTISRWEQGKGSIGVKDIVKIAEYYGVALSSLIKQPR